MKLTFNTDVLKQLTQHAEQQYPNECCGFLFGKDGAARTVTAARRAKNLKAGDRRDRFEIAPPEYREAEAYADEQALELLGIYHSHPDHPAVPSEHDRKAALPFFSYIILSVSTGKTSDIRSWRLNEERTFDEEALKIKKHLTEP